MNLKEASFLFLIRQEMKRTAVLIRYYTSKEIKHLRRMMGVNMLGSTSNTVAIAPHKLSCNGLQGGFPHLARIPHFYHKQKPAPCCN